MAEAKLTTHTTKYKNCNHNIYFFHCKLTHPMLQKNNFVAGDRQLFDDWAITSFLGKGNNTVYEAVNTTAKDRVECVKEIRFSNKSEEMIFEREVAMLRYIRQNQHPNIIEFKGSYIVEETSNQFNTYRKGFIQMEKGIGSLDQLLNDRVSKKEYFSDSEVINLIQSLMSAHRHLQDLQIAHRDVKPQNVIIFDIDPLDYKVCDVGVGTSVRGENTKTRTLVGTVSYFSPELLKAYSENKFAINYNPYKSDVYSLGLLFLYFCTLHKITVHERNSEKQEEILKGLIKSAKRRYPNVLGLSKVLKLMLKYQENERCDFVQLERFIEQNNFIRLKYDALRTTGMKFSMVNSVPYEGQVSIKSYEQVPELSIYTQNSVVVRSLKLKLNNMNLTKPKILELMEQLRKIKCLDMSKFELSMELNSLQGNCIKALTEGLEKNVHLQSILMELWNNHLGEQGLGCILQIFKKVHSHMTHLHLHLCSNHIMDSATLAQKMSNLSMLSANLEELDLDFGINKLSAQCVPALFSNIGSLVKLRRLKLNLQSNRVTTFCLRGLPEAFRKLKYLSFMSLNLACNSIRDEGMYTLADVVQKLDNLKHYQLNVWNCDIKDKGLSQFMKTLGGSTIGLVQFRLIIWNNEITEKGIESFSRQLPLINTIQKLHINLSNNKIGNEGTKMLCKSIIQLKALTELRLGLDCMGISEHGCRYIGRLLSVQKNILRLDLALRANKFGLNGFEMIVAGLKELRELNEVTLVFQGCGIQEKGLGIFNKIISRFVHLEHVHLNVIDCELQDDSMFGLIMAIKDLPKLKEALIEIHRNKLTREMRKRIGLEIDDSNKVKLKLGED